MPETFDLTSGMMKMALWYLLRAKNNGIGTEIDLPGQAGRADVIGLDLLHKQITLVEVKRSRADFRKGLLKLPEYYQSAHLCYLAAPPNIIPLSEVPEEWGLIIFGQEISSTQVIKEAKLHSTPAPFFDLYLRQILEKARDNNIYLPTIEKAYAKQVIQGPAKRDLSLEVE